MDGYELAEKMRDKLGETSPRFVALTGYGRDNDRARALAAGFAEHFAKPASIHDLAAALARLLGNAPSLE